MEEKETMLVGFDIYKFVKGMCEMCDQSLSDNLDMTEGEKKAYRLGVDNVLGLLEQTLDEMIADENESFNNMAVHIPGLEVMTEFSTIEEILKRQKEK